MTRSTWLNLGRVAFVALTGFFAWWTLRGRWGEVGSAIAATSPVGLLLALMLVVAGLVATGLVWLRILRSYGHRLPFGEGLAIFFVGQLGKYVPGSVWSIGVQAQLARAHDIPARATAGASLVFLGVHVTTAVVLGGGLAIAGTVDPRVPTWSVYVVLLAAVVGLLPAVVNRLGSLVSSARDPLRLRWVDLAAVLALMAAAWAAYSLALLGLVPDPDPSQLGALAAAFALSYAAGVVIVLAPAGLGAREGTFVLLLAPVTGVAVATGVALLARVVHSIADFALAAVTWLRTRRRGPSRRKLARAPSGPGDMMSQ